MSKIMTLKTEHSTFEIHLLNAGEIFPGFGGSKRGLLVTETASLIVRRYCHQSGSMEDSEHDIDCPKAWASIKNIMSKATSIE